MLQYKLKVLLKKVATGKKEFETLDNSVYIFTYIVCAAYGKPGHSYQSKKFLEVLCNVN